MSREDSPEAYALEPFWPPLLAELKSWAKPKAAKAGGAMLIAGFALVKAGQALSKRALR